jgi:hypothetical protein
MRQPGALLRPRRRWWAWLTPAETWESHYDPILGTSLELRLDAISTSAARRGEAAALAEIDRLEAVFSSYRPDSEFMRWQQSLGSPAPVSTELLDVLEASERGARARPGRPGAAEVGSARRGGAKAGARGACAPGARPARSLRRGVTFMLRNAPPPVPRRRYNVRGIRPDVRNAGSRLSCVVHLTQLLRVVRPPALHADPEVPAPGRVSRSPGAPHDLPR